MKSTNTFLEIVLGCASDTIMRESPKAGHGRDQKIEGGNGVDGKALAGFCGIKDVKLPDFLQGKNAQRYCRTVASMLFHFLSDSTRSTAFN